ncbi:MAG: hypothetical protein QM802_12780 [Agriterribacter sp.]
MMVKMAPNIAVITAAVTGIEPYSQQDGFSILSLQVKNASPKKEVAFIYNKTEEKNIKALVSDDKIKQSKLKVKDIITIEANKVTINLWRVSEIVAVE